MEGEKFKVILACIASSSLAHMTLSQKQTNCHLLYEVLLCSGIANLSWSWEGGIWPLEMSRVPPPSPIYSRILVTGSRLKLRGITRELAPSSLPFIFETESHAAAEAGLNVAAILPT